MSPQEKSQLRISPLIIANKKTIRTQTCSMPKYAWTYIRSDFVDPITVRERRPNPSPRYFIMLSTLTRHRLGCFCTHHSLGGSDPPPPPAISKRMDVERRTRRHSKDLDETLPYHFRKFKIEVTRQVKVRSKVKIGCFQVADRSDLKRSIFRPKLSICTPKDQA